MTRDELQRRRREVERELRLLRHEIDNRIGELLSELMQIDRDERALDAPATTPPRRPA
ncbi:MAG: hypothetical protein OZ921_15340 [Sorangiineae bacterium]|nr:hypothetical protein [Polyangiaceae bacterium]MEB2323885.1 hypothetical protein [Sorangiineae bacterium]